MSTYSCSSISPEAFCCQSSDNLSRKLYVFMGLLRPSTTFRCGGGGEEERKKKKARQGGSSSSSFSMQFHSLQEKKITRLLWKAFSHKNAIPVTALPHNFHTTLLFAKECKITPGSWTHTQSLIVKGNNAPEVHLYQAWHRRVTAGSFPVQVLRCTYPFLPWIYWF